MKFEIKHMDVLVMTAKTKSLQQELGVGDVLEEGALNDNPST